MKIICDNQINEARTYFGQQLGRTNPQTVELELVPSASITADRVRDADVVLVRSVTPVNADLLTGSSVRAVGSATAGIDHVDRDWLAEQGIHFFYAAGHNADAVAEYTLVCLLLLAQEHRLPLDELKVGIVGLGHIGGRLYRLLDQLNMAPLICDPLLAQVAATPAQAVQLSSSRSSDWCPLSQVWQADIISMHVPLTHNGRWPTHHLLSARRLSQLPEHSCLINTSRGGIQHSNDLIQWADRHPQQLCLDVYEHEPAVSPELLETTLLSTPHIAGYTREARARAGVVLRQQLDAWCDDRALEPATVTTDQQAVGVVNSDGNLLNALRQCVDPMRDSQIMRSELKGLSGQAAAQSFRKLRQHYLTTPPIRHEFSAWRYRSTDRLGTTLGRLGLKPANPLS